MTRLSVCHETVYRYRRPVRFGEHRLMFRPRDSHDMRLISTGLKISPPAEVRWLHDVFGNSIAIAAFEQEAEELRFLSTFTIEHYGLDNPEFTIEPYAATYPFRYPPEEAPDLVRAIERHHPDPQRRLDAWAKAFLGQRTMVETQDLLEQMTRAVRDGFLYENRFALGTQSPLETLDRGSGTCRDFALFLMEAARALGFAARFVSGYLYDPDLDGPIVDGQAGAPVEGAGYTHAWVQIYLPGAGWIELDPTNGLIGGRNLIRVAVVRTPDQAIPLQGSYTGFPDDYLDMSVDVRVALLDSAQEGPFAAAG